MVRFVVIVKESSLALLEMVGQEPLDLDSHRNQDPCMYNCSMIGRGIILEYWMYAHYSEYIPISNDSIGYHLEHHIHCRNVGDICLDLPFPCSFQE